MQGLRSACGLFFMIADVLLKQIDKPGAAVNKIFVHCPECGKSIGIDELKVSIVVNFYG